MVGIAQKHDLGLGMVDLLEDPAELAGVDHPRLLRAVAMQRDLRCGPGGGVREPGDAYQRCGHGDVQKVG